MRELDVDRMLAGFRMEAGLKARAPKYPNWESMDLDGHTAGHYPALAQETAGGDEQMRERLAYMIAELEACQRANADGYIGAVPNGRSIWQKLARGDIASGSFSLNDAWVPFYNLHATRLSGSSMKQATKWVTRV